MAPANSKDKAQQQTRQERARAEIDSYSIKFEERSSASRTLVRKGQRLDVDATLAHSFRDVKSP